MSLCKWHIKLYFKQNKIFKIIITVIYSFCIMPLSSFFWPFIYSMLTDSFPRIAFSRRIKTLSRRLPFFIRWFTFRRVMPLAFKVLFVFTMIVWSFPFILNIFIIIFVKFIMIMFSFPSFGFFDFIITVLLFLVLLVLFGFLLLFTFLSLGFIIVSLNFLLFISFTSLDWNIYL